MDISLSLVLHIRLIDNILFILCNLSFPGSINFISELIALIAFYPIDYLLIILFIISSFLSTFI